MPWNPDTNMLLTKPGVNYVQLEETFLGLWLEYLQGWFNGQEHELDGVVMPFPSAKVVLQQADNSVDGVVISVVISDEPRFRKRNMPGGVKGMASIRVGFWVKGFLKTARTDGHSSKSICRLTGDLLFALLSSKTAGRFLNQKRIHHIRPTPPRIVSESMWSTRLIRCATTCYYVMEQDPIESIVLEDTVNGQFYTYNFRNGDLTQEPFIPTGGAAFQSIKFRDSVTGDIHTLFVENGELTKQ